MDALAALGYAKPLDNAFLWTDRIGWAMQTGGLWDESNLSREELEERDVDREMRTALASLPQDVRHAAPRNDQAAVVRALAARWVDGAWLPDSAPDSVDEALWWRWAELAPEAKRLVVLVQGGDDAPTRDVN